MTLGCKKRADHKAWQSRVISYYFLIKIFDFNQEGIA